MEPTKNSRLGIAIFFIVIATFFFALMNLFAKFALPTTPITIIVFFRFLLLTACMSPFFITHKIKIFHTDKLWLHIVRAIFGVLGIGLTFASVKLIPLSTVVLLSSTEPMFIPFIFRFTKGTPIIPKLYWGIITGLIGVTIILHPTQGYFELGALLALTAGFCRAVTISSMRILTKTNPTKTIMLYFFLLGTIISFFTTLNDWHDSEHWAWGWIFAISGCSLFFQLFITQAFRHAPARILGPFGYFSVVFAVCFDWILWGQGITWFVGAGIVLVIAGATLTTILGREIL